MDSNGENIKLQAVLRRLFGTPTCVYPAAGSWPPDPDTIWADHLGDLDKYFGSRTEVRGLMAGLAISKESFFLEPTIYVVARRDQALGDLVIEVRLNDPDEDTRERALRHVCVENPRRACVIVPQIVRTDPDESVRFYAMELMFETNRELALELAREVVAGTHPFTRLREQCKRWLLQTDIPEIALVDQGHPITPETESLSALFCSALFESEPGLRLSKAKQIISMSDAALTMAIGYALTSDPCPDLRLLGRQTMAAVSREVADDVPDTHYSNFRQTWPKSGQLD